MKIKAKITSTIMSMMLALGVMGFAVYAAATQTLQVNNTVSFISDHVLARITGDVAGATGGNQIDPEALDYDESVTSSNHVSNAFPKWEIGDVEFAAETAPITITINIYNLSKQRSLTFSLETLDGSLWNGANLGDDSNSNITRSVKYSTTNQTPATNETYVSGDVEVEKEEQATIIITLSITDTGKSVDNFDNSFDITLENVGANGEQPEEPTEGFVYNPQSKGLTIPANESLTYENMPETVLNGASAFYGFYRDYNETTNLFENKVNLPYTAGASSELVYARLESAPAEFDVKPNLDGWTLSLNQHYTKESLDIPVMIDGVPVTSIHYRDGFYFKEEIKSISMSELVHDIAPYIFAGTTWYDNLFDPTKASEYDIENEILYLGKVAYQYVGENNINGTIALREDTLGIAGSLFEYENNLTSIALPTGLKTIGASAFSNSGLATLTNLPELLTNLYFDAFFETPWYENLDDGVNYLGKIAFTYKGEMPENTNISFKNDTVSISDYVFSWKGNLKSVTLPQSLKSIGTWAFEYTGLTSVAIPSSVQIIDKHAFHGSELLASVTFDEESALRAIQTGAFYGTGLSSITIPASVEIIEETAFAGAPLQSISFALNSKLHTIERHAFQNTQLASLTSFPNSLLNVHELAFDGTPWLTNLAGNDVHYVGKVAYKYVGDPIDETISLDSQTLVISAGLFANQSQLTSITLPTTLIKIGSAAFSGTGLTSIHIPASVETIESAAFVNITTFTSITFAANSKLAKIDYAVFWVSGPSSQIIEELIIPASVKEIDQGAFINRSIKHVKFEDNSQIIELNNFKFNNLESIDFGDNSSLEVLHSGSFSGVSKLSSINFGANSKLRVITSGAFSGLATASPMETLTIPASVEEISNSAFSGATIKNLVFEDGSQIKEIDGSFTINTSVLESIDFGDNSSLEVLHGGAFSGVSKLSSINFGANSKLRVITVGAFSGLATALPMETLTIPASVEEIGNGAFNGARIKNIVFEDNSKLVKLDSGNRMFASSALVSVSFGLNSSLKEIGGGLFYGAENLTTLVIPSSVTHVHEAAFAGSGITTITIPSGLMKVEMMHDENWNPIYVLSSIPVDIEYLFGNPEAEVTINFHPAG